MVLITIILVVMVLIGFNALYVAGEFATVSASKPRILQAANEGNRFAKLLVPIVEDSHKLDNYIAASQVGITISSIVLGIYGEQQIAPHIEPWLESLPFISGEVAATGISTTLILILLTILQVILGELVPKSLAIQYPEQVAMWTALPMRWSSDFILRPLIALLNGSGTILLKLLGANHEGGHRHVHSPEEIRMLIRKSHEGGILRPQEQQLLTNAFRFGELKIGEIVIPRIRMITMQNDIAVQDAIQLAGESDYTRLPVYEEDIDHIVGYVHLKDLFQLYYEGKKTGIKSIIRNVSFVSQTTLVDEVWEVLDKEETYLAIVFDEYGGTFGMVTREDLIEELFGEMSDEFDGDELDPITKIGEREYLVRGDISVNTLNDRFGTAFPSDSVYTIGGLISNTLGRFPQKGDEVEIAGVQLMVHSMNDRTVAQIRLTLPAIETPTEGEE